VAELAESAAAVHAHLSPIGLLWRDAAEAFDRAGITWCVLRDDSASGGDVDLLVAGGDVDVASRALGRLGYRRTPSWGRRPHRFFARPLPGGATLKLDVVTEVAFGRHHEVSTGLAPVVLARRQHVDGIAVPDPSDRQWLVLLHALADRGGLAARHRAALEPWVGDRADDAGVGSVVPHAVRRAVADHVALGRWDSLEGLRPALWAALPHDRSREAARVAWRAALRRTVKLQRALVRPGVTAAVLGPDGAGKSTVIDAVATAVPGVRVVYLGAYPKAGRAGRRPAGVDTVVRCARLAGRGLLVRGHRRRGRTVLADRHPLEVAWGPTVRSRRTRLRRWLVAHTVAAPDVLVVLDAPADVLHARKPEHSLHATADMRRRYLALARARGAVVVDVDRPLEEVVADVRDAVRGVGAAVGFRR
jgi:thymidylate kinase